MLIGGIVAVVVIVGVTIGVLVRRRSHDDVHSVEHYHRQLHTLEEIRAHPAQPGDDVQADYPAPAFRVGSPAVRLTDSDKPLVPPVPPPPVPNPAEPVKFGDEGAPPAPSEPGEPGEPDRPSRPSEPAVAAVAVTPAKDDERAMQAINHRPRRLAAPLAAIGAVTVLVVVLIVTGLHTTTPPHHGKTASTVTTTTTTHARRTHHPTTTTTAAAVVSAPSGATNFDATYQVADASYSLALSATNGECWVQATGGSGSVLFSGTLLAGQSHTVPATGPVTVVAGAPNAFSATVNGSPVSLPAGFQAPFTLKFVSPGNGGTGTGAQAG